MPAPAGRETPAIPSSASEVEAPGGQLHLAAAFAREDGHDC